MNCPKCRTEAPGGASHCRRCGKALAGGGPKPSASDDVELELKPLEPSNPPAHSDFEPPADLGGPPAAQPSGTAVASTEEEPPVPEPKVRPRGPNAMPQRDKRTTWIIAGALGLAVVLFIGWRLFRTENKVVTGRAKVDPVTWTLQPNQPKVENLEISGNIGYTLEITSVDSSILIGMVQRSPRDPMRVADLKKLSDPLETLAKGQTRTLMGELKAGQYSWVLINESKKPSRAKVKFSTQ